MCNEWFTDEEIAQHKRGRFWFAFEAWGIGIAMVLGTWGAISGLVN